MHYDALLGQANWNNVEVRDLHVFNGVFSRVGLVGVYGDIAASVAILAPSSTTPGSLLSHATVVEMIGNHSIHSSALTIKPCWVSKLLSKEKTWEIRKTDLNLQARGWVPVIAKGEKAISAMLLKLAAESM